jgi:hypothetical protein
MKKHLLFLILCFLTWESIAQGREDYNTSTGTNAGNAGVQNSSFGYGAGDVVTGQGNSFFGANSGQTVTSGGYNSFFGYNAGVSSTTGVNNVSIGSDAAANDVTGSYNVNLGANARDRVSSGDFNTVVGYTAGRYASGSYNLLSGAGAGRNNSGSNNVFLGYESGAYNSRPNASGANNTAIGYQAGYNTTGSSNIFLGKDAGTNETGSNKLYIENSTNTSTPLLYGDFSSRQLSINAKPTSSHALTVGGTVHATGFYVNGVLLTSSQWTTTGSDISYAAGNVGIGTSTNTPTGKLQVNGRLVVDNVGSGGPMGSGSLLSFSSGGTNITTIQENWGLNLNGSATAPVKIANTSLLVGYVSGGGSNYGQGNLLAAGNVGIGTPNPHAQLQLGSTTGNRKLVLYEDADNDQQFHGLGVQNAAFRFQIPGSTNAYRFFRGNDAASSTEVFTILGDGKVGVGTATPAYPLQVAGKIGTNGLFLDSATPAINSPQTAQYLHIYNHLSAANGLKAGGILVSDDYAYAGPGKNDLIVKGKVAIGTPLASNPNNYTLAVNGQIGAKDVRVEATSATWPDYVFEPTYELPSLKEVEGYLKANKHLKEMPSAGEVTEKGHSLGQMDALLVKKVEELTLYMINQDKKLEAQQQEIETLKKRLEGRK